jgi:integrase
MPIYKKGPRRWRVVIHHRGLRRDWVVEGSKKDAEEYEARTRISLQQGERVDLRVAPRFADFCVGAYRSHAETHLKASTWSVRTYQLENLIEHLGDLRLTDVTTEVVEKYKQARIREGRRPVTVNNELAVLQAVLSYARRIGAPSCTPELRFLRSRAAHTIRVWTAEDIQRLYDACARVASDILPMVVFLANTGCRKGEALALTWEHIDLKSRLVKIWPSAEWQPKSGRPREIPMNDVLVQWLSARSRTTRWVFPSSDGERFVGWPKRQFNRARAVTGLVCCELVNEQGAKKCARCRAALPAPLTGGPHTLRHSFASLFLQTTPDLFLLARILGHSDARVTRLYAHLMPDHLARARGAVELAPAVGPAATEAARRWRR